MAKHTYQPMHEAPKDGTPIIAVCGGVEAVVCWHEPIPALAGWWHWDEDDMCPETRVRDEPTGWRKMF